MEIVFQLSVIALLATVFTGLVMVVCCPDPTGQRFRKLTQITIVEVVVVLMLASV
jgi:hypothetical protein